MQHSGDEAEATGPGGSTMEGARGREVGSLIGGVFGLVFIVVNSAGLAAGVRAGLLAVAGAGLVAVVVLGIRSMRSRRQLAPADGQQRSPLGRAYWLVVLIEAVALFAGTRLVAALGHPELGVAWVAIVVGTHFFALGRLFRLRRFHLLAALITLCGLAGFALAAADRVAPIPLVSGVLSGVVLLGFALWAMLIRPVPASRRWQ